MRRAAWLLILVAACGPATTPEPGDPDPVLDPCPAGMARDDGGRCAYLFGRDCPADTYARVGEPECQPIGPGACTPPLVAAGDWRCSADNLPAPEAGWSACGTLDPASPGYGCLDLAVPDLSCDGAFPPANATIVADLAAALAGAQPGDVLAIEDTHAAITIDVDVTIVGPCAARATIEGIRTNANVEVRGVTLSRTARADGGRLVLRDVHVSGASGAGVHVTSGAVELHDSIVSGTLSRDDGRFGRGLNVDGGALLVQRSLIEGNREIGAFVGRAGASLTMRDTIVRDTVPSSGTGSGIGIVAMDDAELSLERTALLANRIHGALIFRGATATFRDVVSASNSAGQASGGVRVEQGGRLDAEGLLLVDNVATGLLVDDADAYANIRNVIITGIRPDAATGYAAGLLAAGGTIDASGVRIDGVAIGANASLDGRLFLDRSVVTGGPATLGVYARTGTITVTQSLIADHDEGGIVGDLGAFVRVADTRVIGGDVPADRPSAGVSVSEGAVARLERVVIEDVQGFGVIARDEGSTVTIDGGLVDRVRARDETFGIGVAISLGARFDASDLRVQDVEGLGVMLSEANATLTRAVIVGTSSPRSMEGGGIVTEGDLELRSVAVVDSRLAGVFFGNGAVTATDLLIAKTRPTVDDGFGHGLIGLASALQLTGFEIRDSAYAGLAFGDCGALVGTGLVRNNEIGVHVQSGSTLVEGALPDEVPELDVVFDADALFIDNVTRIGDGVIPLPSPFVFPSD